VRCQLPSTISPRYDIPRRRELRRPQDPHAVGQGLLVQGDGPPSAASSYVTLTTPAGTKFEAAAIVEDGTLRVCDTFQLVPGPLSPTADLKRGSSSSTGNLYTSMPRARALIRAPESPVMSLAPRPVT
jgi:hypothetical protein